MPAVTAHASDEPPYTQTDSSAEPRRFRELTGYQKLLFALLIWATFFEGFDTKISSLVLPMLGREFGIGPDVLGNLLAGNPAVHALFDAAFSFFDDIGIGVHQVHVKPGDGAHVGNALTHLTAADDADLFKIHSHFSTL